MSNQLQTQREWYMLETAKLYLGTPYKWGGDDILGIDCSGMVLECLKASGLVPSNYDDTANGLWKRFSKEYEVKQPKRGCLVFWFGSNGEAYHVAICVSEYFCITADGGGSKTNTVADADQQNAFVKYRPIDHRGSAPKFVYLFQ